MTSDPYLSNPSSDFLAPDTEPSAGFHHIYYKVLPLSEDRKGFDKLLFFLFFLIFWNPH